MSIQGKFFLGHPVLSLLLFLHSAVIYFKNMTCKYWREYSPEILAGENRYVIPAGDKAFVRDKIVESIIAASELIRYINFEIHNTGC